jgi:hypothetical protein
LVVIVVVIVIIAAECTPCIAVARGGGVSHGGEQWLTAAGVARLEADSS